MIRVKVYEAPAPNRREILRYAGVKDADAQMEALLQSCLDEALSLFTYRVCYGEFSISVCGDTVDFGFHRVQSYDLAKCLQGADRAVIFAATVGALEDRKI